MISLNLKSCIFNKEREMRLDSFLLLQLLLGFSIANLCFLINIPLNAWQFWASFVLATGFAFLHSLKSGFMMIVLNALMFILTLYTFTYTHFDASVCHLPISHFLQDGWNPIKDLSVDTIRGYFANRGVSNMMDFAVYHIIAAPKFSQILAAQMQSAFGLLTAGGYALWFMCFALAISAYRFSCRVFKFSSIISIIFAVLVITNLILVEACFWGLVDYVSYSAIAISAFSLRIWMDTKSKIDLVSFFAGAVIAVSTKMNSIVCICLLLILAAIVGRKNKDMRIGIIIFLVSLLFFCIIPYWASSWHYGSPFYPAHSFRADIPLMDLTRDFIGNEDSSKMGYVARMVYAWVSRSLAILGCKWWYSLESFDPHWKVEFLTRGQGPFFSFLLWSGAILSLFINRNRTTLVGWVLLLAFFLVPVKYIGYPRYACFVYFVVILLWFNILCAIPLKMKKLFFLVPALFASVAFCKCVASFLKQVHGEGVRQKNIYKIAKYGDYSCPKESLEGWEYSVVNRFLLEGASFTSQGTNLVHISWPLEFSGPRLVERDKSLSRRLFYTFPRPLLISRSFKKGDCE